MIAPDGNLVGAGLKILSIINDDLDEPAPTEFYNPKSKIQNLKSKMVLRFELFASI